MGTARTAHPTLSTFDGSVEGSLPLPPEVFVIPNKVAGMPSTRSRTIEPENTPDDTGVPAPYVAPRIVIIPNPIAGMPSMRGYSTAPEESSAQAAPEASPEGWYVEGQDDDRTIGCSVRPNDTVIVRPAKAPRGRRPVRPTIRFADLARPTSLAERRQLAATFSTPAPLPPEPQ